MARYVGRRLFRVTPSSASSVSPLWKLSRSSLAMALKMPFSQRYSLDSFGAFFASMISRDFSENHGRFCGLRIASMSMATSRIASLTEVHADFGSSDSGPRAANSSHTLML